MKKNLIFVMVMFMVMIMLGADYASAVPKTPTKKTKSFDSLNDVEKIDYLNQKIADAQRDLDFEYKFAMHNKIPEGPEGTGIEIFQDTQKSWETYANSELDFAKMMNSFPGSYGEIKFLKLKLFLLEKRILTIKYQTVSMEDPAVNLK